MSGGVRAASIWGKRWPFKCSVVAVAIREFELGGKLVGPRRERGLQRPINSNVRPASLASGYLEFYQISQG